MEQVDGDWLPWTINLPPRPGKSGIAPDKSQGPFPKAFARLRGSER